MAAPAWGSASETHSTGANITAPAPSSTAQNDLLLAFVFVDVNTPTVTTVGSGYTLEQGPVQGSAGDERIWVYRKLAGASEGNTTWGLSVTNRNWSVILCRITGVDTTTPVNASANRSGTSSTSQAVAQPTSTVADCLAVAFTSSDQSAVTPPFYTAPSGTLTWTERLDNENAGSNQSYAVATAVQASASQTPADTWTLGAADSAAHITVLAAPAAGGVTGTAAGSFGFTATASGVPETFGTAAGSLGFTGSAAGVPETFGAAAGTLGFTAAAAGVDRALGAAVGSFGFTGTAQGVAGTPPVQGQAAGSFGLTGTVAGIDRSVGQAVGSFGGTATVAGIDRALGAAAGIFGGTATASGVDRAVGQAAASLGGTGTVAGLARTLGTAAASLGLTGAAAGTVGGNTITGIAAGAFGGSGSLLAKVTRMGVALGLFGATGTASGGVATAAPAERTDDVPANTRTGSPSSEDREADIRNDSRTGRIT